MPLILNFIRINVNLNQFVQALFAIGVVTLVVIAITFLFDIIPKHTMTVNECPIIDPVAQQILACSEISSGSQNDCVRKVMENTTTHIE